MVGAKYCIQKIRANPWSSIEPGIGGHVFGLEYGLEMGQPLAKHWLAAKNFYIDSKDPCQDPQSDLKDLEFHSRSKNDGNSICLTSKDIQFSKIIRAWLKNWVCQAHLKF